MRALIHPQDKSPTYVHFVTDVPLRICDDPVSSMATGKTPMLTSVETPPYDILRREVNTSIWLETSPDLLAAKSRIKQIASFWPGKYEVIDRQSQRIVAAIAIPSGLRAPIEYMREGTRKYFWISYAWLFAPAPAIAGMAAYTRLQKYARGCFRASYEWLAAPMARIH
jgi:hypothetical protein